MPTKSSPLRRADFLRLAALGAGALLGGRLMSACSPAPAGSTNPIDTVAPTIAPALTATAAPTRILRPEIIKFFPDGLSRVIQTHHPGVWSGKTLVPGALRQMLDASITKLTGLTDAREAWAALFKPTEKIAIKVNAFRNSAVWTHALLVQEVTNSLQDAGIPAENITVYDYLTDELKTAGFAVNANGPGVRCAGTDTGYGPPPAEVLGKKVSLSKILKQCDALINMPILKMHGMAGITFALKNHFGSIMFPDTLHNQGMREIAALNALPEIRDKTRLVTGDALSASLWGASSLPYWREDWIGDSIFMSFDPVAHDTLGLELLTRTIESSGEDPTWMKEIAAPAFEYAVELGLGTNGPANMDFVEQTLAS